MREKKIALAADIAGSMIVLAALAWAATMSEGPRRPYWWCGATLAAVTCLAPWIARDAVLTSNPCFPLMSAQLGAGWWSAEQASRFMQAHRSDADVASRLLALWRQAMVFGTTLLLARLLPPSDFGLFGMATVVTGFALLFKDMGTGSMH